jgi:hypothetical protein
MAEGAMRRSAASWQGTDGRNVPHWVDGSVEE